MKTTEGTNAKSKALDEMTSLDIVALMNEEDHTVPQAVKPCLPDIAHAADTIVSRLQSGGRVFAAGAGTSGRLAVLDAAELPPTFSLDERQWVGLIAGHYEAMWKPIEENEDDRDIIVSQLKAHSFSEADVFIGVTASGSTPYVLAGLSYAKEMGAVSVSISCNKETEAARFSDIAIEAETGPEIIRGSTRLKAGTAQKLILNMLSTAAMVRLGHVYQNEMVNMQLVNQKLKNRAAGILMNTTGLSRDEALQALKESRYNVKAAIFMVLTGGTLEEADRCLSYENGRLKHAIQYHRKGFS
ncbi:MULTISPECIES: N-acetylmuramic acid 6-phosphate etherase [Bacillus]|uniref:N-acetylmuramic acid 6-phosphate etherase n=1 Tax=Bacillus glycinifermentans TaxID=1664069 RepID=A0AAJ4D4V7_9BACI|nr:MULTISPECIES: N-acetylmuramic acid 6-phosphate etherase [Bacillus]KKB75129.1 N-acetylmuramic acid-6-phosphate etherase [Bacillus sp. TH008]MBU8786239.1 N-acetylmuramic acid 6-phosphate etherase [Bacillus glycinifermentans]MDU0070152.1 N-acetylmuramic acid 6-phosphate etherase [Bacillus sp. IG6]MED8017914.1 N-acetylmuramic acid 6-phosphate etherase [Bacillus glycinifermentans]NUJ19192.1 N-acetylmuramic acid 6-phosphate etherase [Bacillus glycinifermentans]